MKRQEKKYIPSTYSLGSYVNPTTKFSLCFMYITYLQK